MKVPKPKGSPISEVPCGKSKSGKHDIIVTENPANTDAYLAKCRHCGRYLSRKND